MYKSPTLFLAGCLALAWSHTHAADYAYAMKITVNKPKGSVAETAAKNKANPTTTPFTPCNDEVNQDVFGFQLDFDAGTRTRDKKDPSLIVSTLRNVYLIFYNPSALGAKPIPDTSLTQGLAENAEMAAQIPPEPYPTPLYPELCEKPDGTYVACDPKVWVLVRPAVSFGVMAMEPLVDITDIRPLDIPPSPTLPLGLHGHIYLSTDENLGTGKISELLLRSYMRFDELKKGIWALVGIIAPKDDPAQTEPAPVPLNFTDPTTWAAWDTATFLLGAPWTHPSQTEAKPAISLVCQ